jgi:hypothetical protein
MGFEMNKLSKKKFRLDPFAYYIYAGLIGVMATVFVFQYLVTTEFIQSPENMSWYRRFLYFDYMFLLFFSFTAIIGGLLLVYLGFGGNRKIGVYFTIIGILVFMIGFLYFDQIFPRPVYSVSNVYQALISVLGTIVGFFAAILVSFIVITKIGPHITRLGKNSKEPN